jgi:hypothetical protein
MRMNSACKFRSYLEDPVRNMAAYRKSNKKNTRRKKTQFKKGHKCTSTVKEPYTDNSSSASVSSKSLSLSFSSSIFTGRSFVGSTFTSHLLVDCAERASANFVEVGLCRRFLHFCHTNVNVPAQVYKW